MMKKHVLLIIDMQNDFCHPKGSLFVPNSPELVLQINEIMLRYQWDDIIETQDYHPKNHVSFFSSHSGKKVLDTINLVYTEQIL